MGESRKTRTTINVDSKLKKLCSKENINISKSAELGIKIKQYGVNHEDLIWAINNLKSGKDKPKILEEIKNREDLNFRRELRDQIEILVRKYESMIDNLFNPFKDELFWFNVEEIAGKFDISPKKFRYILIRYITGEYDIYDLKNLNRDYIEAIQYNEELFRIEKGRVCKLLIFKVLDDISVTLRKKQTGKESKYDSEKKYLDIMRKGAHSLNISVKQLDNFCKYFCECMYRHSELTKMNLFTREDIIYFSNADKKSELEEMILRMPMP